MTASTTPRHLGILLFVGMEELDGPWEVFAWWTRGVSVQRR